MTGKSELPPEVIDILMKELAELIALVDEVRAICDPDDAGKDRSLRHRQDTLRPDRAPPQGPERPPSPRP